MSVTFPYTLTNGTTADADEVQANFDEINNNMVDNSSGEDVGGLKVLTNTLRIKNAAPLLVLEETGAAANEGKWRILANDNTFYLAVINDAESTAVVVLDVTRTATVVDLLNIKSTSLQHNGVDVLTAIYKTAEIDIGAWDMDATTNLSVSHGLNQVKIRSIFAMIRNDANNLYINITKGASSGDPTPQGSIGGSVGGSTVVNLNRLTGGSFDGIGYDQTSNTINNAAAVDKGGGLVGIPITAHTFEADDKTTLSGTTNYNATYTIISETTNEIVITASYIAETFAGSELASWSRGTLFIEYKA